MVVDKWIARLKASDLEKRELAYISQVKSNDVARTWSRWRNRLIKNRTQRWTRDMASREKAFARIREERVLSTVLNVRVQLASRAPLIPVEVERPDERSCRWSHSGFASQQQAQASSHTQVEILGSTEAGAGYSRSRIRIQKGRIDKSQRVC